MTDFNLIDYVVPTGGYYCVVGAGSGFKSEYTKDRAEVDILVEQFVKQRKDVYFMLGKITEAGSREATNVESLQSVWVDIDCGTGKANDIDDATGQPKGYETKKEAQLALKEFCETVGLPFPAVIDSGGGIHAYWALTEEVPRTRWLPICKRLKQVCVTQEFYADQRVFDASRILRVPGTFNQKYDPPAPVTVIRPNDKRITPDDLREILGVDSEAEEVERGAVALSPLEELEYSNYTSVFKRIVTRSDGCLQLQDCIRTRQSLEEPRWFDALSIAKFCSDSMKAAVILSEGHPDYSFEATQRKMHGIKGPHSCTEFASHNPEGCKGCPHKGKIKTPITLGQTVKRASNSVGPVKYRPPYLKGENGGIYVQDKEGEAHFVYEYDFYISQRMTDPNDGDVAIGVVYLPKDGKREFTIQNEQLDSRELTRVLAKNGILADKKSTPHLHKYVIDSIKALGTEKAADKMRVQFGWADGDTSFIVGESEIKVDGVYHSPPSTITNVYSDFLQPRGSYEKWQEVFNMYNRPGLEVHAFAALSGFGSTLLKFTGQKGAIINLVHPHAGTGKTTILRMANSIAGDPEMLLGTPDDTAVGRINKLGTLNNIVNTMDELTNLDETEVGKFAYAASQGRGKEKAQMHINANRKNEITWRNITLSSSNSSFYQKLMSLKNAPDGELMRIIEFTIDYQGVDVISTAEGKQMFDHQLSQNFGHAIVPFIQYVMANPEHMKKTLLGVQAKIDKELSLTQRERNWSAIIASNIAAGILAVEAGIIEFDMKRIFHRVAPEIKKLRLETVAPVSDCFALIGEFINEHVPNVLSIDAKADARSGKTKRPYLEPRGALYIREEPDANIVYIAVSKLRKYWDLKQVDYNRTIAELKAKGCCIKVYNKDMGKGMPMTTTPTRCVWLDSSHPEFIGAKTIAKEADNASGESELPD